MYRFFLAFFFLSTIISGQDISTGLVVWYKMNGNTLDSAGSNHAISKSVYFDENKFGNSDASARFYRDLGSNCKLPVTLDYSDRSVTVWFKVNTTISNSSGYLYSSDNDKLQWGNTEIFVRKSINIGKADLYFLVSDEYPTLYNHVKSIEIDTGVWYQATIVVSAPDVAYYLNCTLVDSSDNTYQHSTDGSYGAVIGSSRLANNQYFDGWIDEVRLYSRSLNMIDIDSLCSLFKSKPVNETGFENSIYYKPYYIYPNPVNEVLNFSTLDFNHYIILNSLGQIMKTGIFDKKNISVNNLCTGIYVLLTDTGLRIPFIVSK